MGFVNSATAASYSAVGTIEAMAASGVHVNAGSVTLDPDTIFIDYANPYRPPADGHDHLHPLVTECFTRSSVRDIVFVNCDPTGSMDRGILSPESPESGWQQALAALPGAAARAR